MTASLVAPSPERIVVFEADEDWSYPGCELDEIECAEAVEDAPDGSTRPEPGPTARQIQAEILNEAPARDSWRPTPRLGGGFR